MNTLPLLVFLTTLTIQVLGLELPDLNPHNRFAADVYKQLMKSFRGNFVASPLSAQILLALTQAGARGQTGEELAAGLCLPQDKEQTKNIFGQILKMLENNNITIANRIYMSNDVYLTSAFKRLATDIYKSEVKNIDFGVTGAVAEMNGWIAGTTKELIRNLLSSEDVNQDTLSVLISTLLFQRSWKHVFVSKDTVPEPFYLNNHEQRTAYMMQRSASFNYYESKELDAKFIELPFNGDDISMTVVLPNDIEGLDALEAKIQQEFAAPNYDRKRVLVKLPKYKMDTQIDFKDILQKLGVKTAFSDDATFQDMTTSTWKIDQVKQRVFIEIDEAGSLAASGAGGSGLPLAKRSTDEAVQFIANHPFLYYIKLKDIILLAGRYVSP